LAVLLTQRHFQHNHFQDFKEHNELILEVGMYQGSEGLFLTHGLALYFDLAISSLLPGKSRECHTGKVKVFRSWFLPCKVWQYLDHSCQNHRIIELQNRRIIESWNHTTVLVGRDLNDHLVASPLPWTGPSSTRTGCSKPRPTWP